MKLQVSKKVGMWGFGPLWFTFADPKPQDINLSELDEQTREKVNIAVAQGILIQINQDGELIGVPKKKKIQTVQCPVVNEAVTHTPQIPPVIERKLTELLKSGVTTLRREIPLIKSHQTLSAALYLEKQGKSRKTVMALLEKIIEKTGNIKIYDDLIKDEDVEVIKFKIEEMVLESKEEIIDIEDTSSRGIKEKMQEL
jgi:hypothetical protein